jgi:EamA domain-containing membrane protein RarD
VNPVLLTGVITVNLALVFYTIGFVAEQRSRRGTPAVLAVLILAVVLDLVATGCMMTGSRRSPLTLHGLVGYSALAGMILAVALVWRQRRVTTDATIGRGTHLVLRVAYSWWVIAYLMGAALAMRR